MKTEERDSQNGANTTQDTEGKQGIQHDTTRERGNEGGQPGQAELQPAGQVNTTLDKLRSQHDAVKRALEEKARKAGKWQRKAARARGKALEKAVSGPEGQQALRRFASQVGQLTPRQRLDIVERLKKGEDPLAVAASLSVDVGVVYRQKNLYIKQKADQAALNDLPTEETFKKDYRHVLQIALKILKNPNKLRAMNALKLAQIIGIIQDRLSVAEGKPVKLFEVPNTVEGLKSMLSNMQKEARGEVPGAPERDREPTAEEAARDADAATARGLEDVLKH